MPFSLPDSLLSCYEKENLGSLTRQTRSRLFSTQDEEGDTVLEPVRLQKIVRVRN